MKIDVYSKTLKTLTCEKLLFSTTDRQRDEFGAPAEPARSSDVIKPSGLQGACAFSDAQRTRTLPAGQQLIVRAPGASVCGCQRPLGSVAARRGSEPKRASTNTASCSLRWTDGDRSAANNTRLPEQRTGALRRWKLGEEVKSCTDP